jgi:hypothetical protein
MPGRLSVLLEGGAAGGRAGLAGLRMQQLAGLAGSLARAGVLPSNAWLVGLMQVRGGVKIFMICSLCGFVWFCKAVLFVERLFASYLPYTVGSCLFVAGA